MTTPPAVLRHVAVRAIRALVVVVIRIATVSTVHADTAKPEQFAEELREAHFARVGISGRTYVLVKPRVTLDGLAYAHLEGGRPAIFIDSSVHENAPPNPVPWSSLERVEAGYRTREPGLITGLAIGLVGGALVGTWLGMSGVENAAALIGTTAVLGGLAGSAVGALFPTTRWTEVDPGPQDVWR